MTRERGFSLFECLIAITIAALLLGIGLPDLRGMYLKHRADSEASQILRHLQKTRELAVMSGREMTFCGVDAQQQCVRDNITRFVIFFDGNKNRRVDAGETVESELEMNFSGEIRLRASGTRFIRYFNDGTANPFGSVFLCPSNAEPALIRRVSTNRSGRTYLARSLSDGVVANADDSPVNCST